jgi:hypothetical protein
MHDTVGLLIILELMGRNEDASWRSRLWPGPGRLISHNDSKIPECEDDLFLTIHTTDH